LEKPWGTERKKRMEKADSGYCMMERK